MDEYHVLVSFGRQRNRDDDLFADMERVKKKGIPSRNETKPTHPLGKDQKNPTFL